MGFISWLRFVCFAMRAYMLNNKAAETFITYWGLFYLFDWREEMGIIKKKYKPMNYTNSFSCVFLFSSN